MDSGVRAKGPGMSAALPDDGTTCSGEAIVDAGPIRRRRRSAWSPEREVVVFFAASIVALWVLGLVVVAAQMPYLLMALLGASVPLVVAAGLIWRAEGTLRPLWGQLTRLGVAPRWYAAAIVVAVVAVVAAQLVIAVSGRELAVEPFVPWWAIPLALPVFAVLLGGQEEPGWRGFALPRLQQRFSAWSSSLIIGVVWAVWHVPMFVFDVVEDLPYLPYALVTVGLSVVYAWLFNSTDGAVPIAMTFHGAWNLAGLWLPGGDFAWWVMAVMVWAVALLLVAVYGAEDLARNGRARAAAEHRPNPAPSKPSAVEIG